MNNEQWVTFYKWSVNLAASVLLVLLWKLLAWGMTFLPWVHLTEDQMFMLLVAVSVALNLPSRRPT